MSLSHSPTLLPTTFSTTAPTLNPITLPTSAPTTFPTTAPTLNPTTLPTSAPTTFPTTAPTTSPSSTTVVTLMIESPSSVTTKCHVDEDGFYSNSNNNINSTTTAAASTSATKISFFYQVKVVPTVLSTQTMEDEILPKLESSIISMMLLTVFRDSCRDENDTTDTRNEIKKGRRKIRRQRRNLQRASNEISGLSTKPTDRILNGVNCLDGAEKNRLEQNEGSRNNNNNCFVVDAQMTMYYEENPNSMTMIEITKGILEEYLSKGLFNEGAVDERIIAVEYLSQSDIDNLIINKNNDNNGIEDGIIPIQSRMEKGMPIWGVACIVIGAVFALCTLIACPDCPCWAKTT